MQHIRLAGPALTGCLALILLAYGVAPVGAAELKAGAARVDITNVDAGPVNDRLHARALVIQSGDDIAVIVSVDAVAIGEIGHINNQYLGRVRSQVERDLKIKPSNVMINASHCHGVVCADVDQRTIQAITQAHQNLVPVRVGAGSGREDRIMENRRLKMKGGREIDLRRAYSMPPDNDVAAVGPVDPQIGILRLDRLDGRSLAVVYNFACHPIQGVPGGGNTADMTGFASKVIEDNLSEGTVALFVQGCGGDINPIGYKAVDTLRDAESLGNQLGLSTLAGWRKIASRDDGRLKVINETLALPRADVAERIAAMEDEQTRLVQSFKGTNMNLKTFVPLLVKHNASPEYPSYYAQRYLHEQQIGRKDLETLDADNRRDLKNYIDNIQTMEQLTRLQTNLQLLKKHQRDNIAAGKRTIDVEVVGLRIGELTLITFPGELTVQIGLNIKQKSPHEKTFVAGYTNGYIYYAPTADQLLNVGGAQEDSDCILAPEWQALFESKAADILKRL